MSISHLQLIDLSCGKDRLRRLDFKDAIIGLERRESSELKLEHHAASGQLHRPKLEHSSDCQTNAELFPVIICFVFRAVHAHGTHLLGKQSILSAHTPAERIRGTNFMQLEIVQSQHLRFVSADTAICLVGQFLLQLTSR